MRGRDDPTATQLVELETDLAPATELGDIETRVATRPPSSPTHAPATTSPQATASPRSQVS